MHTSRLLRLFSALVLLFALAALATACGDDSGSDDSGSKDTAAEEDSSGDAGSSDDASGGGADVDPEVAAREGTYDAPPKQKLDPKKTYTVHVKTNKGDFDIVLDQKAGPNAAANFAFLVKEGFYDGVIFHRIIKDFMVQTGDPTGTGTGGPGYAIKDDKVNGAYTRGTVAMANAGPNTGGSQFFIVHGTTVDQMLGPDYAIFGHVDAKGMKTIDAIADTEVEQSAQGEMSQPTETVKIESATLSVK